MNTEEIIKELEKRIEKSKQKSEETLGLSSYWTGVGVGYMTALEIIKKHTEVKK